MGKGKLILPEVDHLASKINEEHRLAFRKAGEALEHARAAGALLSQAKSLLRHGEWLPWLQDHCEVAPRTAQDYMRLAENWHLIDAKCENAQALTVEAALKSLPKRAKSPALLPSEPSDPKQVDSNARASAYLPPADPQPDDPKDSEIERLKAEAKAKDAQLAEMAGQQAEMQDELVFLQKIETEGDKLSAALKEVKRLQEMVRVLEERNRGMQRSEAEAIQAAKRANAKVARLEKQLRDLRGG